MPVGVSASVTGEGWWWGLQRLPVRERPQRHMISLKLSSARKNCACVMTLDSWTLDPDPWLARRADPCSLS